MGLPVLRQRNAVFSLLVFLAVLCLASAAPAAIIHIPADQATILDGFNAAQPGDTLLLAAGTYSGPGNVGLDFQQTHISIIGDAGSAETIIDCANSGRFFRNNLYGDYSYTLSGFTVINAIHAIDCSQGSDVVLRDLRFRDCVAEHGSDCLRFWSATIQLNDVIFDNCAGGAFYFISCGLDLKNLKVINGTGQSIFHTSYGTVSEVLVAANAGDDGPTGLRVNGGGIDFSEISIVENGDGGLFIEADTPLSFRNSIVAFNYGIYAGVEVIDSPSLDFGCNDVFGHMYGNYNPAYGDQTGQNGNISADPRFCDLPSGDYSLQDNSPCLPAGNGCAVQMGMFGEACVGQPYFNISGTVLDDDAMPLGGVRFVADGIVFISQSDGSYNVTVEENWSGTLTPVAGAYHFEPSERSYSNVMSDQLGQDYVGTLGQVWQVPGESPTIEHAITQASSGDTILLAPGTYSGPGNRELNFAGKELVLMSSGGPDVTIIDGEGNNENGLYAIHFNNGETAQSVLDGFTIRGFGWPTYAAVRVDASSPTLRNLHIRDNEAFSIPDWWGDGIGLRCDYGASPHVSDTIFENNWSGWGGAVATNRGSSPIFTNVIFRGNHGRRGGAVYLTDGAAEFHQCSFLDNVGEAEWVDDSQHDPGAGGAVYCRSGAMPLFSDCLFAGNYAQYDPPIPPWDTHANPGQGGAVHAIDAGTAPRFLRCTFYGNWAEPYEEELGGGGFYCTGGAIPVLDQVIVANSSEGGGIFCASESSIATLTCCDVWGNVGGDYLGSIPDQTGSNGNISADPQFCYPAEGDFTLMTGSPCLPAGNSCGLQMGAYGEGCDGPTETSAAIPAALALGQNHPNPFNPSTEISFSLPRAAVVSLIIYDAAGRQVRVLLDEARIPAGHHALSWHGHDGSGRSLPSGIFFYRLEAEGFTETRKMLLLK